MTENLKARLIKQLQEYIHIYMYIWNKSTVYLTHNWCVALISHFIWWVPHTSCVVQSLVNRKDFCFRKRMIKRNAFAHNQGVKQRYHDMVWLTGEAFLCMKKSFLLMPTVMTYMEKFPDFDWQRASQFIPNGAEGWNWVQKIVIECRKLKLSAENWNWVLQKLMTYMEKFLDFDWQRASQFISNSAEGWNWVQKIDWVQKVEIKLINKKAAKAQRNEITDRGKSYDIQSLKKNAKRKTLNKAQTTNKIKVWSLQLLKTAATRKLMSVNRRP